MSEASPVAQNATVDGLQQLAKEFEDLADTCLLVLHLEVRIHFLYCNSKRMKLYLADDVNQLAWTLDCSTVPAIVLISKSLKLCYSSAIICLAVSLKLIFLYSYLKSRCVFSASTISYLKSRIMDDWQTVAWTRRNQIPRC